MSSSGHALRKSAVPDLDSLEQSCKRPCAQDEYVSTQPGLCEYSIGQYVSIRDCTVSTDASVHKGPGQKMSTPEMK